MIDCNKSAIITGATGFIGFNLAKRLVDLSWNVHLIIRPTSNLKPLETVMDQVTLHIFEGKFDELSQIINTVKPNIVFHLASLAIAEHQADDIEALVQSNILFGTQLIEAMIQNEVYNFINTGTFWQHYESADYSPVCLYAATKEAFEKILIFYLEATPLKVITLKLFDTYGSDDPRPKLLSLLNEHSKSGKELWLTQGEQLMDLVYIDDVLDAYVKAAERIAYSQNKNEKFAVSSQKLFTLKHIVELYMKLSNKTINIKWGKRPYRKREVMVPWRGQILPGWRCKVSLEEGLKKCLS